MKAFFFHSSLVTSSLWPTTNETCFQSMSLALPIFRVLHHCVRKSKFRIILHFSIPMFYKIPLCQCSHLPSFPCTATSRLSLFIQLRPSPPLNVATVLAPVKGWLRCRPTA